MEEDIEQMLDAELPEELKNKKKEQVYEERYKIVLDEKGRNHFEVLPEGWLQATHNSGMPIYLHKTTRVCTTSKPYFLGPGSVRVRNSDFFFVKNHFEFCIFLETRDPVKCDPLLEL